MPKIGKAIDIPRQTWYYNTTADVALPAVSLPGGGDSLISSDIIRGYTDTMILFIVSCGDSYGYEISKQIKEISEENYVMKETTLYSALTRLEKNGFITSYSGMHDGRKRTYYRITDDGKAYYKEKCEEWELTKEVIDKFI